MHRFELDRHYDEIQWKNIDSVLFISEAMERKFHAKGDYKGKTFVTYDNLNFEDFPLIQKKNYANRNARKYRTKKRSLGIC